MVHRHKKGRWTSPRNNLTPVLIRFEKITNDDKEFKLMIRPKDPAPNNNEKFIGQ